MINPDLIQRCSVKRDVKKGDIKGFDSVFALDYMGSAEFEFGAVPASLKEVVANLKKYKIFPTSHKTPANEGLFLFCPDGIQDDVKSALKLIVDGKARLKESTYLNRTLSGEDKDQYHRIVMWWDLLNHYFVCLGKDTAHLLEIALGTLRERWLHEGKIK